MQLLGGIFRYIGILAIVLFISSLFAHQSWNMYDSIFHDGGSSWINLGDIAGFAFNYALFTGILVWCLGDHYRHWIMALFYVPLLIYEYEVDFDDLRVVLLLIILGIVVGFLIRYLASKTLGKMPSLEPLKKYF